MFLLPVVDSYILSVRLAEPQFLPFIVRAMLFPFHLFVHEHEIVEVFDLLYLNL